MRLSKKYKKKPMQRLSHVLCVRVVTPAKAGIQYQACLKNEVWKRNDLH
jgi:hypothetical protein